jgi:hypothetical protein
MDWSFGVFEYDPKIRGMVGAHQPGESYVHKTSYRRHLGICNFDHFKLFHTRTSTSFTRIYTYSPPSIHIYTYYAISPRSCACRKG